MDDFTQIEQSISNYFPIIGFFNGEGSKEGSYFIVGDYNPHSFQSLVNELDQFGFVPFINPDGLHYRINVARKPEKGQSKIHVNLILLLATIGTTIFAGYYLGQGDMWKAVAFAIALLAIIGTHELAHFFAARKHGVDATLPYFIPAPTIIGTFGALINIKSAIPTRKALFDLGYSGPLAGFIVAIPVLLIGLKYSTVATNPDVAIAFTPPLIMQLFSYLVAPAASSGQMILMHPVAFAGWVGILVTMLNLMPVAFLDGGHISRSLFGGSVHKFVSILGIMVTIILGWYLMAALMVFIFLMGRGHPGALDNVAPMDRKRKIISVVILIIFVLCLSPAPNNFM
ncbi:MAG: site-2 protease family protein [Methanobacterium formicicum]